MATASVSTEQIEITPGICGGKPRIAGHRITVQNVVIWHERMGMNPDEIVATHPTITLADVHAALAYYHDHEQEIRNQIRADEEFVAALRGDQPSIFEKVRRRHAQDDPLPLDEHCDIGIARGLRRRGIDVTTAHEAGLLGAVDEDHVAFGLADGRMIFTQGPDFMRLHAAGVAHHGIAYRAQLRLSVEEIIRGLVLIWET